MEKREQTTEIRELNARLPDFEFLERLGRGGMGVVYKARQRSLDRPVAVKALDPRFGRASEAAERFAREARILASLEHPNILTVHDFKEVEGQWYIVMEYVRGVDLSARIRAGDLGLEEVLKIIPRICDALQFAHDRGVIHRDIKPSNILIDESGEVKVADFGLARMLDPQGTELTRSDESPGTPLYASPEQRERPEAVDHRCDIYALGVVFYEMLTGEVPVGHFEPPSATSRQCVRLDDVVMKALEYDPDKRHQQASELKDNLSGVVEKANAVLKKPAVLLGILAIGAVAFLAGLIGAAVHRSHHRDLVYFDDFETDSLADYRIVKTGDSQSPEVQYGKLVFRTDRGAGATRLISRKLIAFPVGASVAAPFSARPDGIRQNLSLTFVEYDKKDFRIEVYRSSRGWGHSADNLLDSPGMMGPDGPVTMVIYRESAARFRFYRISDGTPELIGTCEDAALEELDRCTMGLGSRSIESAENASFFVEELKVSRERYARKHLQPGKVKRSPEAVAAELVEVERHILLPLARVGVEPETNYRHSHTVTTPAFTNQHALLMFGLRRVHDRSGTGGLSWQVLDAEGRELWRGFNSNGSPWEWMTLKASPDTTYTVVVADEDAESAGEDPGNHAYMGVTLSVYADRATEGVRELRLPGHMLNEIAVAQGGVRGGWVEVLPLVDVARDAVSGQWVMEDGGLKQLQFGKAHRELMLPVGAGDSYEMEVEFTKLAGEDCVNIRFPVRRVNPLLIISGYRPGYRSNIQNIRVVDEASGKPVNPSTVKSLPLENGRRYRCNLRVVVDGDEIEIVSKLDGKDLVQWRGPIHGVFNASGNNAGPFYCRTFAVGNFNGAAQFHRIRMRSLEGASLTPELFEVERHILLPLMRIRVEAETSYRHVQTVTTPAFSHQHALLMFGLQHAHNKSGDGRLTWQVLDVEGRELRRGLNSYGSPWEWMTLKASPDTTYSVVVADDDAESAGEDPGKHAWMGITLSVYADRATESVRELRPPGQMLDEIAVAQGGKHGEWADVLPLVDVERDAVSGHWVMEDGSLKQLQITNAHLQLTLPVGAGDSYEMEVDFTKLAGEDCVGIRFPVRRVNPLLSISGWPWAGYYSKIGEIVDMTSGKRQNPARAASQPLENGRRYRCSLCVVVRGDQVRITSKLDGQDLVQWRGPIDMVVKPPNIRPFFCRTFAVGNYNGAVQFHRVRMRSLEGASLTPAEDERNQSEESTVLEPGSDSPQQTEATSPARGTTRGRRTAFTSGSTASG